MYRLWFNVEKDIIIVLVSSQTYLQFKGSLLNWDGIVKYDHPVQTFSQTNFHSKKKKVKKK